MGYTIPMVLMMALFTSLSEGGLIQTFRSYLTGKDADSFRMKIQPAVDVEKIEFHRGECIEHPSASAEHVLAPTDELLQPSAAGNPSSPTSTPPRICFIVKGEDGQIVAKLTKNWDKIKMKNDSLLIDLTAHFFTVISEALEKNAVSMSKVQGEVEKLSKTYCGIFRCDRKLSGTFGGGV